MNLLCSKITVNDVLVYREAIAWPGGVQKIDVEDWNEAARELVIFYNVAFAQPQHPEAKYNFANAQNHHVQVVR